MRANSRNILHPLRDEQQGGEHQGDAEAPSGAPMEMKGARVRMLFQAAILMSRMDMRAFGDVGIESTAAAIVIFFWGDLPAFSHPRAGAPQRIFCRRGVLSRPLAPHPPGSDGEIG